MNDHEAVRFQRWNAISIGIVAGLVMVFTSLHADAKDVNVQKSIDPDAVDRVSFASLDSGSSQIKGYLLRPDWAGPFPAVIALHGCGGLIKPSGAPLKKMVDWAKRISAAGYVVLFPDSFGSRNMGSLCNVKERPVTPRDRASDAAGAAAWLASRSFVDPKRITLLGWSNGGTTVLWALEPNRWPNGVHFSMAIAFYPWCRYLLNDVRWRPNMPLTILIGSADDWTPPEPCEQLSEMWGTQLIIYQGAYHSFDHPNMERELRTGVALSKRSDGLAIAGTDPAARQGAISQVLTLLNGR